MESLLENLYEDPNLKGVEIALEEGNRSKALIILRTITPELTEQKLHCVLNHINQQEWFLFESSIFNTLAKMSGKVFRWLLGMSPSKLAALKKKIQHDIINKFAPAAEKIAIKQNIRVGKNDAKQFIRKFEEEMPKIPNDFNDKTLKEKYIDNEALSTQRHVRKWTLLVIFYNALLFILGFGGLIFSWSPAFFTKLFAQQVPILFLAIVDTMDHLNKAEKVVP